MKLLRLMLAVLACCLSGAGALAADSVIRSAAPGQKVQLDVAPCLKVLGAPPPLGTLTPIKLADGSTELWYTPALDQRDKVNIQTATGGPADAQGNCVGEIRRTYEVSIDQRPKISADATETAYRVLIVAFVLAVLLESAFELLFNWRLFQEFFVGRAWRTPIMFAVSLLLVKSFNFDLMATLFDAYSGVTRDAKASAGNLLTQSLTAMILGGGSVGINRVLVNLGFREMTTKVEAESSRLSDKQAYISVLVRGGRADAQYEVDVTELPADPAIPMTLGVLRPRGPGRIKEILFPSSLRLPRSGGRTVSTEKCYRIAVRDLGNGSYYDTSGVPKDLAELPILRFAPGAFVDFVVNIHDRK
jgi:hypothetical protein